jgi:hypothetical protein
VRRVETASPQHALRGEILEIPMTDTLYVLHQGYGGDGALWCATWDGTTWSADTPLNASITGGPAVVAYNGVIHVFRQGTGDNTGVLLHTTCEDGVWSADESLGAGLSWNPAAVVYDDKIWVFHQDGADSGAMYYMTYDGESWSADTQIPLGMSFSPSAAVYDDKIWLFHVGYNGRSINHSDFKLWCTTYDGTSWSADDQLTTAGISGSPGATVHSDRLYVFYQQNSFGANGKMSAMRYDGTEWDTFFTLPCGMSESPAPVSFDGYVRAFHQGYKDDGTLWYVHWDGSAWDPDIQVPPMISDTPGVAVLPGS